MKLTTICCRCTRSVHHVTDGAGPARRTAAFKQMRHLDAGGAVLARNVRAMAPADLELAPMSGETNRTVAAKADTGDVGRRSRRQH